MKWEYLIIEVDTRHGLVGPLARLNGIGAQGWEVITAERMKDSWIYHAKRPIEPTASSVRIDLGQPAQKP